MKILFINISDIHGGAAKSMWRIAEQLEKEYNTENYFIVRSKYSDAKNVIEVKGNRIINIIFNLLGLQYKFLPVSRKIVSIAKHLQPDVISLNQIEGGYFQTRDIKKLQEIAPIIWTMHDEWAFNNNASSLALNENERKIYPSIGIKWGNWLKNQKQKIFNSCGFTIIYPSASLASKSNIKKYSEIIPHGIDTEKFKPGKVAHLLFVAEKTSKAFGIDKILSELDKITKNKIILTVAGKGEIKGGYKNILVVNRGFCNEDELLVLYQNADLFIYPSQADSFGLVVLEAMACGCPVVAFGVGGVDEILEGHTIPPFDFVRFAERIEHLLNHPNELIKLGKYLRLRANANFNIKDVAKKYYEVFKGNVK